MSRVETLDYPDYILIDLDPQECPFDKIIDAMGLVKDVLDEIGLEGLSEDDRRRRHARVRSGGAAIHV